MPFAYSYYGYYDYCCSEELSQNGACGGEIEACDPRAVPCANHPSVDFEDEGENLKKNNFLFDLCCVMFFNADDVKGSKVKRSSSI